MIKFLIFLGLILIQTVTPIYSLNTNNDINPDNYKSESLEEPKWAKTNLSLDEEIYIWRVSYPDVRFDYSYDEEVKDWKIVVSNYGKSYTFYWCNGLYLPKEEIPNREHYWRVITPYNNKIINPAHFNEEKIESIKKFSSPNNRKNGKVSSKAIFDAIYDCKTRRSTETHIKQLKFLNRYPNVHEYLHEPLKKIEKKILRLSLTNKAVKKFLDELSSCEGYNWREIRDSSSRSFHSYGIALDILPKGWGNKIVYWGFEKNKGNKEWMLIPVKDRWMPPKEVIDIFLEEGFIWGGNWAIWDNMHFEYHPELTYFITKKNLDEEKALFLLDGRWDYYDSQYIDPEFFYKKTIQDFDKSLYQRRSVIVPYEMDSKHGIATYHYRISNLKPLTEYSTIMYKVIYSAADLYVNGKIVYKSPGEKTKNGFSQEVRDYRVVSFKTDIFGNLDFVFHVGNKNLEKGGILAIPHIGSKKIFKELIINEISFKYFIIGFLIIIALYNLIIFVLNISQRMFLYLTLLCIDLVVVVASLDFSLFGHALTSLPISHTFKITLTSLSLIIPLYNLYATSLYEIKSKRNISVIVLGFIVPILVVLIDMKILSKIVGYLMLILYGFSFYLCWLIFKKCKRPRYFYILNIIIIIFMLIGSAYSLIFQTSYLSKGLLFKISIIFFAFSQSILAAIKRNIISNKGRKKINHYERLNISYSRYNSKYVMGLLQYKNVMQVNSGDNIFCEGMILSVKIRDYSNLIGVIPEDELNSFIVKYYEIASQAASENNGYIAKYYSDEILIVFSENWPSVCKCAINIKERVNKIKKNSEGESLKNITVDMFIDSGKFIVGIMGNEFQINSVICSEVLKKMRDLEGINSKLNFDIIISDNALNYCRSFSDCLFEGVFANYNNRKILLYKVYPFENEDTRLVEGM